jgi:hypothetical protein
MATETVSLEEAGQRAVAAAMHGDLEGLMAALEDRATAIAAGQIPTAKMLQDGEDAKGFLEDYIRSVGLETARVRQMQLGFSTGPETIVTPERVNCRG